MSHWYRSGELKFEKIDNNRYMVGRYEIVRVKGYNFAFHDGYLLNRDCFKKLAAYLACLERYMGEKYGE